MTCKCKPMILFEQMNEMIYFQKKNHAATAGLFATDN